MLYGADSDYSSELQALINKVLEDILEELSKLKDSTDDGVNNYLYQNNDFLILI